MFVCDRGEGASQVGGESFQDTDETAPVKNCDATCLDAEEITQFGTASLQSQLRSSDRVSDSSMKVGEYHSCVPHSDPSS